MIAFVPATILTCQDFKPRRDMSAIGLIASELDRFLVADSLLALTKYPNKKASQLRGLIKNLVVLITLEQQKLPEGLYAPAQIQM